MVTAILKEKGYEENSEFHELFYEYYVRNYLKDFAIKYVTYETETSEDVSGIDKNLALPMLANAIYLTIYSDFEYFLLELCKMYKKTLNLRIDVKDLKGDGVIGSFNYLDKVVNIENVKNNRFYQDLPHWNRVRNYLIHNSSIVDDKCKESVDRLELKMASSLDNEIIMMDIDDVKKFVDLTNNLQKLLIL